MSLEFKTARSGPRVTGRVTCRTTLWWRGWNGRGETRNRCPGSTWRGWPFAAVCRAVAREVRAGSQRGAGFRRRRPPGEWSGLLLASWHGAAQIRAQTLPSGEEGFLSGGRVWGPWDGSDGPSIRAAYKQALWEL